jgi:hypothetical protein
MGIATLGNANSEPYPKRNHVPIKKAGGDETPNNGGEDVIQDDFPESRIFRNRGNIIFELVVIFVEPLVQGRLMEEAVTPVQKKIFPEHGYDDAFDDLRRVS